MTSIPCQILWECSHTEGYKGKVSAIHDYKCIEGSDGKNMKEGKSLETYEQMGGLF
jgi:hypothetical protein